MAKEVKKPQVVQRPVRGLTPRAGIAEEVGLLNQANDVFDRLIDGDFEEYRGIALGAGKGKITIAKESINFRMKAPRLITQEARLIEQQSGS